MMSDDFYAKCPRCTGGLEPLEKVITTVSPEDDYNMTSAKLHECIECGQRVFVRGDWEGEE